MQVHILLQKTEDGGIPWRDTYTYQALASVELEVVPKGYYVIEGVTYQTTGIPKFFIETTRDGHTLNHVEIIVQPLSKGV